jgi:lipoate-protein ligase A
MDDFKVRIIPHKKAEAAWNLALEEALYLNARRDLLSGKEVQPIVKMYSFPNPSVVLGYMQKISEIDYDYCKDYGVDVTMRTTGGGSIFLGKKDMHYSLLLNDNYSKELLKKINMGIIGALQDVGFAPQLVNKDGHDIVRLKGKGLVFDAQRRFKNLLLHHGTTLVDDYDYEHMVPSLKASKEEAEVLKKGNTCLANEQEIKEMSLIRSFEKNLPEGASVVKKDYTNVEIKLARKLYNEFYTNKAEFSIGGKKFGICNLTSTPYDMEKYMMEDMV